MEWIDIHATKDVKAIIYKLSNRQRALLIVAKSINISQFILFESSFDMDKAVELEEKLYKPSKVAEYLDFKYSKIDDLTIMRVGAILGIADLSHDNVDIADVMLNMFKGAGNGMKGVEDV